MLKRKSFHFVLAVLAWLILSSWGDTGHKKIAGGVSKYFDPQLRNFQQLTAYLEEHSSDADNRKSTDKNEGIKHYIDLDNYAEFLLTGAISQVKDSMTALYGESFVNEQGILPWSTIATFDSLTECFSRLDFEKARVFAADLSHYVADGHMPLHITHNYNGQITGNKGIHSQYEIKMIGNFVDKIQLEGGEVELVGDVSNYIFNYLYSTYCYADSILLADTYARSINSDVSSYAYSEALWEKTKDITLVFFEKSAKSIADLIYTAWVRAGSPLPDQKSGTDLASINITDALLFFNVNDSLLHFECDLKKQEEVNIKILNVDGEEILKYIVLLQTGHQKNSIDISELGKGVYFFIIQADKFQLTKKFII